MTTMSKTTSCAVALAILGSCCGCCSVAVVDNGAKWALPITIPADIVLFPVEAVGLYMLSDLAGVK